MKKYFADIPINQFVRKENRIMYALGDLAQCYKHMEFKKDGFLFKAYYRQTGYWQGYYLKYSKKFFVSINEDSIIFLRNSDNTRPYHAKILYQDKFCRLIMYSTKNRKSDFLFVLKGLTEKSTDE